MSVVEDEERDVASSPAQRPPRASVGRHRIEEEVFGTAYDSKTVRRSWAFRTTNRVKIHPSVAAGSLF